MDRENGWRKFCLAEMVWITCLRELRKLGFPLTTLRQLRENLFYFEGPKGLFFSPDEFAFFVMKTIAKMDVVLVVASDGRGSMCLQADYENSQIAVPLPTSYVMVNINKIYAELTNRPELGKKNNFLFLLSKKEQEVLYNIAFKDVAEVKITTKDKKIGKVEFKKNTQNPDDVFSKIREELKDGKRKRISLEVQDGKIIAMENTEKT
jgi:hypothetical protein